LVGLPFTEGENRNTFIHPKESLLPFATHKLIPFRKRLCAKTKKGKVVTFPHLEKEEL